MQVLCMKGTVAQWFSRRATDLQLHVHLSCQTKQHEMNAVKTFDMESYRFQVKVTIRCVYIVVFWGINLELAILKLMLNAVYCKIYKIMFNVHMFKKKFGMLQENIGTNAKSCEICNEKTHFFFWKIRFRKKFVSTYLHCLNVATPLEFKFTLNGKWNSLGDLKNAQH